ncbi:MAG TPA: DUF2505 domain-containing protein [Dermatophilaceae bacterium]
MKISAIIDYAATPDEVFAMLVDEDFQNHKCAATGALRHTVSISEREGRTLVVSIRDMPSHGFPAFVKTMVGATLAVTETQDWGPADAEGSRYGTLTVAIAGAPVRLEATLALTPGGEGSLENIEGNLKAAIPLLGGKVEQAAAPAIWGAIRVEGRTGKAWLER